MDVPPKATSYDTPPGVATSLQFSVTTTLVTGATGYVGGRLIPYLLQNGISVHAYGRSLRKLSGRFWSSHPSVKLFKGDITDKEALYSAAQGCTAGYYLVHSMRAGTEDFEKEDSIAAHIMSETAQKAGLKNIIYLGGLGEDSPDLSPHLKSRAEVGEILRQGGVPVTILRAAMIIGSGSASFEILRYLVERLPVMVTPRWVKTPFQPVGIQDVIYYLHACLIHSETIGKTLDIGSYETLTYKEMIDKYAECAGLNRRVILPVPVLTPKLSSYWIDIVTPAPAYIARPLTLGLANPVLCRNRTINEITGHTPLTVEEAIQNAINKTRNDDVETSWTDSGILPDASVSQPGDPEWTGGTVYTDKRQITISSNAGKVWDTVSKIGIDNGYYSYRFMWKLRGFLDRLLGGPGLRRGRRNHHHLRNGDSLDFWRVTDVQPERLLTLTAEMKLPGSAQLKFEISPDGEKGVILTQNAVFETNSFVGIIYWHTIKPLHNLIFSKMIRSIKKIAELGNVCERTRR